LKCASSKYICPEFDDDEVQQLNLLKGFTTGRYIILLHTKIQKGQGRDARLDQFMSQLRFLFPFVTDTPLKHP
jgi:hypothetical protein